MDVIRYSNMVLAFGLELAMLASFGHWGFLQGKSTPLKYLFAAGLVILAITVWGLFAAPASNYRMPFLPRLLLELLMFLLAAFLLHTSGLTNLAALFACVACLSVFFAFVLNQ